MEWKPTDVTILFVYCWISTTYRAREQSGTDTEPMVVWTAVRTLLKMVPVGPKHVEIQQYTNKIMTSVGLHSICWKDARYKKLKKMKLFVLQSNPRTHASKFKIKVYVECANAVVYAPYSFHKRSSGAQFYRQAERWGWEPPNIDLTRQPPTHSRLEQALNLQDLATHSPPLKQTSWTHYTTNE